MSVEKRRKPIYYSISNQLQKMLTAKWTNQNSKEAYVLAAPSALKVTNYLFLPLRIGRKNHWLYLTNHFQSIVKQKHILSSSVETYFRDMQFFSFFSILGCDTNLTSLKGEIIFPLWNSGPSDYPRYTCKWNIELGKTAERRHVELQFTKFNLTAVMPECSGGDYVELFLGCKTSSSIGKFCGQTSLPLIYSPDHCIQVVLHTSVAFGTSSRSEFQAVYNQRLLSRGKRKA